MNPIDRNSPFNGPLTPRQFRQSFNSAPTAEQKTTRSLASPIRYAPLAIAGLALLVLPITIWQINTQQDIRQRASEIKQEQTQNIVAMYGDERITDSDIDEEYTKQQNATTYMVAPTALREQILNDLIRKKIIEKEAKTRGITASNEDISEKIKILENLDPLLASNREAVKDMALEDKLAAALSDTKIVNIVFSSSSSAGIESFLELIRNEATEKDSLVAAATPYSRQSQDVYIIENVRVARDSYLLPTEISDQVFLLEPSDLSEILPNKDKLFIYEIISQDTGEYRSLEEFIAEKKSEVKIL